MARIQPNPTPNAQAQAMLDGVKKKLGSTPNIFKTMAHSPATLGVFTGALAAIADSPLGGGLREQIALVVAGANGCDYCASAHTALGKMHKVADGELAQNLQGKSADAKVQAALNFARKIVEARGNVPDTDLQAVRNAGYSEAEIVDIITVTCINIFTNYFNHVSGTDVDFPLVSTATVKKAA